MDSALVKYHFCDGPVVDIRGDKADKTTYRVQFYNQTDNRLEQDVMLAVNSSASVQKAYYCPWRILIWLGETKLLDYAFSLKGTNVIVMLTTVGLGDTLAWVACVEEFRKRHQCKIYCSTSLNDFLASSYPEITFMQECDIEDAFALYRVGCHNPADTKLAPKTWYQQPLQDIAKSILGLEDLGEIKPVINLTPEEDLHADITKTICIGTDATNMAKQWNYPGGWQVLVDWLVSLGYRVVNLSITADEKLTGVTQVPLNESLTSIASYLKHCDFFIGLTSGLSWLAWTMGTPVVMISGATYPWHEFKDKIHVGPPKDKCQGCINRYRMNRSDFEWCPDKKNFECTKSITPAMVQQAIIERDLISSTTKNQFLADMSKPLWSFVLIAKNEAQTIPRFMNSIKEFTARGGQTVIVDTGSTDGTPEVARSLGCIVHEEGTRFMLTLDEELCKAMNERFIVDGEPPAVTPGTKLFNYAAARNVAASHSPTDVVAMPDCDEVWTRLNIDVVNAAIRNGIERFEYNFVFSHDQYGNEVVKFLHSKFYDRRKVHWEGIVHEVLMGDSKTQFFDEQFMKLEHFQNPATNRGGYLPGLALDCFQNPEKDRNSHYFGRELMFTNRFKSAIKELERHVLMDKWLPEKAQSVIYIGDCWFYLGDVQKSLEHYFKAYVLDGSRREALLRIANLYFKRNDYQRTAAFAAASLTIPWNGFYSNLMSDYTFEPHQLLYWALWWLGDRTGSKEHWEKAFNYSPFNPKYIGDGQFYQEYKDSGIDGWMRYDECCWLYEMAKKMTTICEVGSWKGRSTHALLSGCKQGTVTAVDTFKGSAGEDWAHREAKQEGDPIFTQFIANVGKFNHLEVHRATSLEAASAYPDKCFDMVFIDADHNYEAVKADIKAWLPKARLLIAGHDYIEEWSGVKRAIHETVGLPECGAYSLWYKWLVNPKVTIVLPTLGRPEKLQRCLTLIRQNAGYSNYEVIVKCDEFPPHNRGVPLLVKEAVAESTGELVMYLGNDCVPQKDFLLYAVLDMARWFPDLDGMVGLNDGYWKGECATHWLASKKLLTYLGGEFFHTGYFHAGCDNELTERCRLINKYGWSERAFVGHDHPVVTGFKPEQLDEVHRVGYADRRLEHDRCLLLERARQFGFKYRDASREPKIPRQIFSIWLSEKPVLPELVSKCLRTHRWPGYRHRFIKLSNCFKDSKYLQACLTNKLWARAADYLRMHYLYTEGGVYFDADLELLRDVDEFLTHKLVCPREDNGFIGNWFMAAQPGNPHVKAYLDKLEETQVDPNEKDGTWHAGMGAWTVLLQEKVNANDPDLTVLGIGATQGIMHHHTINTWKATVTAAAQPLAPTPA